MKHLVIAEKPSVARDIARVLKCSTNHKNYIEGNDYVVTWALGHLVTLADPEQYDEQNKNWNIDFLPFIPEHWKLIVIKQTSAQYKAVKSLIFRKDISNIIIATDAGREGELVARWILEKAGNHKPLQRLWISSVTDKAIKEGFNHLKPGSDYNSLFLAAQTRAKADWVVGINATRALTCKYNAQLSCGRVQTPTLAMIASKEEEIRQFIPRPYYTVKVYAGGICFQWVDRQKGTTRIYNKAKADSIRTCTKKSLSVTEVSKKQKKSSSPALYDLTALQKEASARYGFSAKQTLNIMQRLYETHKVLTYPRTDSRYLTSDMTSTLKERLNACATGPYRKIASKLAMHEIRPDKSFVNNAKVSDHHAIIPTEQFVCLEHMSNDEKKIYDMVVRRFLSVLSPQYEYEEISVTGQMENETFRAKCTVTLCAGWKEIYENEWNMYDNSEMDDTDSLSELLSPATSLQNIKNGDTISVSTITVSEEKTSPPARFTEGTLIAAMENPARYVADKNKAIMKTLDETGGIGTVATRADIIEKLLGSFLMEKKDNYLYLTAKGRQLLELVPTDLKSPELTAQWEQRLKKIALGKENPDKFLSETETYTRLIVEQIRSSSAIFKHENITRHKCPDCGKLMLEVNNKNCKMLICQDRQCGYRETIARKTNARCPVCHKKMELTGKGDSKRFVCSCGYKEKLSAFQTRKEKEGKGANKRDVAAYMKKQKIDAEKPLNNAFADALKNITLS